MEQEARIGGVSGESCGEWIAEGWPLSLDDVRITSWQIAKEANLISLATFYRHQARRILPLSRVRDCERQA